MMMIRFNLQRNETNMMKPIAFTLPTPATATRASRVLAPTLTCASPAPLDALFALFNMNAPTAPSASTKKSVDALLATMTTPNANRFVITRDDNATRATYDITFDAIAPTRKRVTPPDTNAHTAYTHPDFDAHASSRGDMYPLRVVIVASLLRLAIDARLVADTSYRVSIVASDNANTLHVPYTARLTCIVASVASLCVDPLDAYNTLATAVNLDTNAHPLTLNANI